METQRENNASVTQGRLLDVNRPLFLQRAKIRGTDDGTKKYKPSAGDALLYF